jgi:polyisoprenoid-binding protein YceI
MTTLIPAGTWTIDASHSEVGFSVRHLMISKVKGTFKTFEGTLITGETNENFQLSGSISVDSIDTNDDGRNAHLKSADFFDAETFPLITFASTSVRTSNGEDFVLDGEVTIHGITKPITLNVELGGIATDPYGQTKIAAVATGKLKRSDFGLTWNTALESGGVLVGDEITLTLEAQATLQA